MEDKKDCNVETGCCAEPTDFGVENGKQSVPQVQTVVQQ
jgi:hypothetical protein